MIRLLITTIILINGLINSYGQEKHTVTIHFEGMKSDKGKLYVALYNKEENFLKKLIKGEIATIKDGKSKVILEDLPAGVYAVSAFQDENNNQEMDTNFLGIPKEPIGISNNATGFFGPPKFKDAKFSVEKDVTLSIRIQ